METKSKSRKIFFWGANSYGQLSSGDKQDSLCPSEASLTAFTPVAIKGGGGHTLFLTDQGKCFACGWNNKGQLGLGIECQSPEVTSPRPLAGALSDAAVESVAAGWDFTLAVTSKGELYGFGANGFGQLGSPCLDNMCNTPTLIESLSGSRVGSVSCGLRHSVLITGDGSIFTSGVGKKGQLGRLSPEGAIVAKSPQYDRVDLPEGRNSGVKVVTGSQHTAVLTDTGQVFTWGDNRYGQLAHCPSSSAQLNQPQTVLQKFFGDRRVTDVYSGWTHMLAVTDDGQVYSWGRADYGQTGRTNQRSSCSLQWQPERLVIPRASMVACGAEHNLLLSEDGKLYTWGWNEHGMCATGDEINVLSPGHVTTISNDVVYIGSGAGHSFAMTK